MARVNEGSHSFTCHPHVYKLEYNLRLRQYSKQLLSKTTELNNRDYIVRMLYKDAY